MYTIEQRNNAISAYLGGPKVLKSMFFKDLMDEEFHLIGLEDLRFHLSWDWLIPVWSKVRLDMSPMMVIGAISYIDLNEIEGLHQLISQVCIDWCIKNKLKL